MTFEKLEKLVVRTTIKGKKYLKHNLYYAAGEDIPFLSNRRYTDVTEHTLMLSKLIMKGRLYVTSEDYQTYYHSLKRREA